MQVCFYENISSRKIYGTLILWCFYFIGVLNPLQAQDSIPQNTQRFNFSFLPNTSKKSMEPYYKALKAAEYGTQRFSVIEQLADHHIKKGTSDSIVFYGNLYLQEIKNWDREEKEKFNYYTQAYYILGVGSRLNGLLDNAVKWHINGITTAENANNKAYQYRHAIELALVYKEKNSPQKAIATVQAALSSFQKEISTYNGKAKRVLGDAYYDLKDYGQAKTYYVQAMQESKEHGQLEEELRAKLKLGTLAEEEGRFEEALSLYNTVKEEGLRNGFNIIYFEGTIRIGNLFYKEGNYDAATIALSTAYINTVERGNLQYQAQNLNIQRKVFSARGDYENAYAIMTQLAYINHQINSQQQRKITKELEVQYETLKKEKEILSLQEEQIAQEADLNRQKTIKTAFLIGFLVILIPIIALLYVYYQKLQAQSQLAKKQEEINLQKVASLEREQELNLIKASIEGQDEERKRIAQELHDSIGGNLAGIKLQLSSISEVPEKMTAIGKQLDDTYQLVRDISHTLIPKKFRQNELTQLIAEYSNAIDNSGTLDISFHPHPISEINSLSEKIQMELFKIIQELITNTMKHAEAQKVDIHLNHLGDSITLLFEDDGRGFDPKTTSEGIGLDNIRNRVAILLGTVHIDTALNRGTVVSIEIPIKKENT
ncbi:tetratricopeptide repeat-containing sensor histidine kinase [Spongiimicrobium salis]|uniref:tetratricopeptide repeat-containing sensor histidine kinase n=1 Tax=Spongiimicrobium salis TaxID=1667022 RepID=UPI00374D5A34